MIETLGGVAKLEQLKTVEHYILPNSFVLENLEPYPGYHGNNLPMDSNLDTFFLITTEAHSPEKIFRIAHNIRRFTKYRFDACPASICIGNDTYSAIRIRDIDSYEPIEEIQRSFYEAGIRYLKKKNIDTQALIELKKIFVLEEITDEIWRDKYTAMHYVKIHKQLTWSRFRNVTNWVKNNIDDSNFDAALAVIYGRDVHDLIRIYAEVLDLPRLENIRQKYIEGIRITE